MISEKYQKQLEAEKRNKEIITKILTKYTKESFIDFYKNHTQKETLEFYKIPNLKVLRKILEQFEYDFSIPKPSKFKGKTAARSHESYLKGGQKSSETQKKSWENKSEAEKQAWRDKMKDSHASEDFKQKIKQINIDYWNNLSKEERNKENKIRSEKNKKYRKSNKDDILKRTKETNIKKYGVDNFTKTKKYKEIIAQEDNLKQRNEKTYKTKTKNNSWNYSEPENIYYKLLINKFGNNNIIKQYKDSRYPFFCDFYVKSLDLFIELNLTWNHGNHLFNKNSKEDQQTLEALKEKAKTSKYYANVVNTWAIRDPLKFQTAKKNNLNYKAFYTLEEAENWLNTL